MNTTYRGLLLALVFALIASSLLAVDTDAKRKHGKRHRENRASIVREIPNAASFARQIPNAQLPVNPDVLTPPEPDPCAAAEAALNGFLPRTVTLKKTDSSWTKLTVKQGVSVLACDLSNGSFEVRFNNVQLVQYGKLSSNGVSVGGWNQIASVSGAIRVSFTIGFSPPSTVILSNLNVLAVNFTNVPNWLDNTVVKDALNAIFPNMITIAL